jgi:hypothetical protein
MSATYPTFPKSRRYVQQWFTPYIWLIDENNPQTIYFKVFANYP